MRPELWLYRAVLWLLLPLVGAVLHFRDRLHSKSRPCLSERLARNLPEIEPGGIWIQAVSVGEVEIARRLTVDLLQREPNRAITVTATTATGLALARRTLDNTVTVLPCPLDLARPVRRMFDAIEPSLLVLVETELWPEMLAHAADRNVPVAVVNARLSETSFGRYRRVRGILRRILAPISLVLARSNADCERFADLGVSRSRIQVVGNIKYDLEVNTEPLAWADQLNEWASQRTVIVAGSTMEGEEDSVLDAILKIPDGCRKVLLILAPRHPERFDAVAERVRASGCSLVRRSLLDVVNAPPDVFLLDTIGELGRAYGLAQAAFIGGSLALTGGHNPLEPAVWGVPVATGPNVHNFREVYDEMFAEGGAVVVDDANALADVLTKWVEQPSLAERAGEAGRQVVLRNRGATAKTVEALVRL
ncbi:MAG: 3-deoxy-D-manno-octulosonic acid transferase [bacterium]|nr:3-deoxy-D-manno-octulosonic acid transferase [bacterium]